MSRILFLFAVTMFAVGCGGKTDPQPQAANSGMKTGKPDTEEARQCVASFLAECGYSHVEIRDLKDSASIPAEGKIEGEAWAYNVSMECTDILGGRRQNEGWTVVVHRKEGRATVSTCFDHAMKKVSGQTTEVSNGNNNLAPIIEPDNTPVLVLPAP